MKKTDVLAKVYMILIFLAIYLPTIFLIVLSFNTSAKITFPIEGFTFDWYFGELKPYQMNPSYVPIIHDQFFWDSVSNSIRVSGITAVLTCIIVTLTALTMRYRLVGRDILFYMFLLGFITPGVLVGLGTILLFRLLGSTITEFNMIALNTVYASSFGFILMMARFDPNLMLYEYTASALKVSPIKVFRYITLPLIKWEVLSSAIMGFLLSWGELIRNLWVARGTGVVSTFVFMQLTVYPLTTKWFAAGSILAAVSIVGLIIMATILSRGTK
ncbi:MAG: ABC transporter permease [Candidatus Bathycorpusculaceae bacterium]